MPALKPVERSLPSARLIATHDDALEAARTLAASWRRTAAEIDANRRLPMAELAELGQSGLLAITVPREHGGPGLPTSTLIEVFLILAQTDTALAQVPQNHFDFVDTLVHAEPETAAYFYAEVLAGARFGNAIAEPGRKSRADLATTIVEDGDHYLINGTKYFCTGALTADWVPVLALHADGRIRTAYLPRHVEGLDIHRDWDAFGQRGTFSGTTVITNVRVPKQHVVNRSLGHPGILAGQFAGNQLIHAAIEAGSALAGVDIGARLLARRHGAAGAQAAKLGELWGQARASQALVRRAARLVDAALAHPDNRDAVLAAIIGTDEAKSVTYQLAPAIANELPLLAAPDDPIAADIERLWRNTRTHSLHDPVRWRQHYVGDFHLNGRLAADVASRFGIALSSPSPKT